MATKSNITTDFDSLLQQFKDGNQYAFKILYENYWCKVANFATLYIRNKEDIQDVVQDIFVKVWENRHRLDSTNNFNGYLFITTRNYIFNQRRNSLEVQMVDLTILNVIDKLQDSEGELQAKEIQEYIDKVMTSLSPQRRLIFELSRKEHKSYKEIAEALNISEKSVEYHISETLKLLREKLKGMLGVLLLFLYNS